MVADSVLCIAMMYSVKVMPTKEKEDGGSECLARSPGARLHARQHNRQRQEVAHVALQLQRGGQHKSQAAHRCHHCCLHQLLWQQQFSNMNPMRIAEIVCIEHQHQYFRTKHPVHSHRHEHIFPNSKSSSCCHMQGVSLTCAQLLQQQQVLH